MSAQKQSKFLGCDCVNCQPGRDEEGHGMGMLGEGEGGVLETVLPL